MANEGLQVENGNFTRIVNPLIEELIKIPFKGCELAVAIFIIRKSYGYQKKQDTISLSQFCEGLGRSRQTIITAVKNLELLNIVVKTARPYKTNTYAINKYFDTWKLVKTARLVKRKRGSSLAVHTQVVVTARHTKEIKKIQKKEDVASKDAPLVAAVINSFKEVNPSYEKWFARPPQREAARRLVGVHGLEQVQRVIKLLPTSNTIPYFPTITTPLELEDRWAKLESAWKRKKNEQLTGKNGLA